MSSTLQQRAAEFVTAAGTAYFAYLASPRVIKYTLDDGTIFERAVYSVTLVFDEGADLSEVERIVREAADRRFGNEAADVLREQAASHARNAAEAGTNVVDAAKSLGPILYEAEGGKHFPAGTRRIDLSSNERPGAVVSFRHTELRGPDFATEEEIYSGMRCKVRVSAYAYDIEENRGVVLNLGHLQVTDATLPRLLLAAGTS